MMIREIKQYRWKLEGDSEEPIKRDDHAMDELRYYLMYRGEIGAAESAAQDSTVIRHKKMLARRLKRM